MQSQQIFRETPSHYNKTLLTSCPGHALSFSQNNVFKQKKFSFQEG